MPGTDRVSKKIIESPDGRLVETLPDGRHKTNLPVLINSPEAKKHFREIAKFVKRINS